jgi:hypothetical protein
MNFSKVGMKYVVYSYDQRWMLFCRENEWKHRESYKGSSLTVNEATVSREYVLLAIYYFLFGVFLFFLFAQVFFMLHLFVIPFRMVRFKCTRLLGDIPCVRNLSPFIQFFVSFHFSAFIGHCSPLLHFIYLFFRILHFNVRVKILFLPNNLCNLLDVN